MFCMFKYTSAELIGMFPWLTRISIITKIYYKFKKFSTKQYKLLTFSEIFSKTTSVGYFATGRVASSFSCFLEVRVHWRRAASHFFHAFINGGSRCTDASGFSSVPVFAVCWSSKHLQNGYLWWRNFFI